MVYLRTTTSTDLGQNADTLDAYFNQRLPPSRRYGPYRPTVPTGSKEDALTSSLSAASTGAGSTAVDVEKGTTEPDGSVTGDPLEAAREELAVAEVSLDVNEKVGGLIQDDPATEGLEIPRGIPTQAALADGRSASPKKTKGQPGEPPPEDKKAPSPHDVKRFGRRKAKKIAEGKLAVEDGKVYDMSLIRAMYHTFAVKWWIAVACLVCSSECHRPSGFSDTAAALQTTAPLVTRIIVNQLEIASAYHSAVVAGDADLPEAPKSVGYGIGLAVGLFAMQMGSSVFNAQMMQRASVIGFLARASVGVYKAYVRHRALTLVQLIDLISRKSM
jgi:ATP-binding cassette subfamily C (CFTR/MRP) protein 1